MFNGTGFVIVGPHEFESSDGQIANVDALVRVFGNWAIEV